ncbi:MAG: glucosaminidase domain-containing protein [Treponema sp.]|jgi:hypothetical protein|nr:glucosaminidase domain-containing protein [Treponema sp.]
MKKIALLLAFFVCFINCQGFAKGKQQDNGKADGNSVITGGNNTINNGNNTITGGTSTIDGGVTTVKEGSTGITGGTTSITGGTTTVKEGSTNITGGTTTITGGNIVGVGNQDSERKSSYQAVSDRIPVIPKIVEFLLQNDGSSDDLKFYLSKPFTLKIYEQNETSDIEISNKMVILNPANENLIEFSIDSEGLLTDIPGPDKGRELQIHFQMQDKTLVFRRNGQQNYYELSSIMKDNSSYQIAFSESIQLYISGRNKQKTEVQVSSVDFSFNDNQPPNQNRNTDNFNDYNNRSETYSKNITGGGFVKTKGVIEYVYSKERNPILSRGDIEKLIDAYIEEAAFENINHDIAIAQMLYATSFFKNKQLISSHNYAGLSKLPNWDGRFTGTNDMSGMTEGIRAHIQHLKGYAKETPKRDIVDPRYQFAADRGSREMKFEQLYNKWSENPGYKQKIENILHDLYTFSGLL